jgi:hypothetical protein
VGRAAKTTHADRLLIRALWKRGRSGERPLTALEIAEKFGVHHMTIRRVIEMDEVEMEQRRRDEAARLE